MRPGTLFTTLILAAPVALAAIYKSIGPDGLVQYSDRPMMGGESVPAPPGPRSSANVPAEPRAESRAEIGPYEAFEIASPAPNATVRSETGELQVSLLLAPSPLPEHTLQLLIDGQPVPGAVPGTQITLNAVALGTHRLQAQVLDELDVPVAYSGTIVFHMRKPVPESILP